MRGLVFTLITGGDVRGHCSSPRARLDYVLIFHVAVSIIAGQGWSCQGRSLAGEGNDVSLTGEERCGWTPAAAGKMCVICMERNRGSHSRGGMTHLEGKFGKVTCRRGPLRVGKREEDEEQEEEEEDEEDERDREGSLH